MIPSDDKRVLVERLREIPSVKACLTNRQAQGQLFPGFKPTREDYRKRKPKIEAVIDRVVREFF